MWRLAQSSTSGSAAAGNVVGKKRRVEDEDEEMLALGDKGGGKGKKGGGKKKGSTTIEKEVLESLVRLALTTKRDVADLSGALCTTAIVAGDLQAVVQGKDKAKRYSEEVQKQGAQHTIGPPHVHIVDGFLTGLIADLEAKGEAELKKSVETMLAEMGAMDLPTACERFQLFRIRPVYGGERRRVTFIFMQGYANVTKEALRAIGGELKMRSQPRTNNERRLQKYLDG